MSTFEKLRALSPEQWKAVPYVKFNLDVRSTGYGRLFVAGDPNATSNCTLYVGVQAKESPNGWFWKPSPTHGQKAAEAFSQSSLGRTNIEEWWFCTVDANEFSLEQGPPARSKAARPTLKCRCCTNGNDFAEPNCTDGGFICFSCRSTLWKSDLKALLITNNPAING